ncbi:MAG: pyridoxal phosphate-dependent aminotransferase [Acidobacteria bacterium]|nr:pyridoxal phosphate-dependent aminotransferase [Acidobacteriota bacterium]
MSEALARHLAAGKPLLDLTVSNPTECGFVFDEQKILNALANPAALHYHPDPRGLESARRAVATYYTEKKTQIPIESIFLTTSTSEAYSFVLRLLCNSGDEILVPAPSYPLLAFLADIQDVKIIRYPLLYDHGWQIDFQALEQAITSRTRAVVIVHPNNPTGHFTKPTDVARLSEICISREIAIIADDVFLDFSLTENRPLSFAACPPEGANPGALTFTLSGLSKISGLPQMKISWLIVSGPKIQKSQALARLEVIADTFLSPSAPAQLAAPAFLELRHSFQNQLMSRVGARSSNPIRRRPGHRPSPVQKCLCASRPFLRFPFRRISDRQFDNSRKYLCGWCPSAALYFLIAPNGSATF